MMDKQTNRLSLGWRKAGRSGMRSVEAAGLVAWQVRGEYLVVVSVEERIGYNSAAAGFH